ncbi:hypothetical protein [Tianweitania sediminis]|uniref:Uncharacterized protein n=1 Tax=Tianweitania sediminis TaxID=1502156 RepID=A0A8J7R596_9HYPH|nr:hypothetical protein [Tianweitania sediminis]MBP0441508.1 hypothetical protein [Tianweitania sediminis]
MTVVSMTYRELADRLGMKPESARKAVRRKGWTRTVGNDGMARVLVPQEDLPPVSGTAEALPPARPADGPGDGLPAMSRELELKIEGLRALLVAEGRRADAAEADRDRWHELATRPWWRRLAG